MLQLQPITLREANRFVLRHHRHHGEARGCRYCIAIADATGVRGVAIVSRPVACAFDDGWTAEVVRCCTDGIPNGCSMLYGACWRAAKAMGYRRLITYIRSDESGVSLRGSGWALVGQRPARSWARESGRHRVDKTEEIGRLLFEMSD